MNDSQIFADFWVMQDDELDPRDAMIRILEIERGGRIGIDEGPSQNGFR